MKKIAILLLGIALFLTGCAANTDTVNNKNADIEYENEHMIEEMKDAFFNQDYSQFEEIVKDIQQLYPDSKDSMLAQVYLDSYNNAKADEQAETDSIDYKKYIQLLKVWTSEPNRVGGVDLYLKWKNVSDKTIKYAHFACDLYNAVDDRVSCEIRNNYTFRGKVTGPIEPGQIEGDNTYWDTAWYNNSGKYPKIIEIELEYMDGTKVTIPQNKIDELFY